METARELRNSSSSLVPRPFLKITSGGVFFLNKSGFQEYHFLSVKIKIMYAGHEINF